MFCKKPLTLLLPMKRLLLFLLIQFLHPQLKSQALTYHQVYDLHIGDEIGMRIWDDYNGGLNLQWLKVINRQEISKDSLILTYYRRTLKYRYNGNIFSDDTFNQYIHQLDSPVFKNFYPHYTRIIEDTLSGPFIEYRDSIYTDKCGAEINSRYYEFNGEGYYEETEDLAFKGLGIFRQWRQNLGSRDDNVVDVFLEYYVKNGDTCGNTIDFPLDLHAPIKQSRVNLYPNPCSDILYIRGLDTYVFKLYNLHGQLLKQGAEQEVIHVGDLSSGLYILELNGIKYRVLVEH